MGRKISISQKYFIKHLVGRLKDISQKLSEVDDKLFNEEKFLDEWRKIRDSNIELEEIIEVIE